MNASATVLDVAKYSLYVVFFQIPSRLTAMATLSGYLAAVCSSMVGTDRGGISVREPCFGDLSLTAPSGNDVVRPDVSSMSWSGPLTYLSLWLMTIRSNGTVS